MSVRPMPNPKRPHDNAMLTALTPGTGTDVPRIMPVMPAFHPAYGEAWSDSQCRNMLSLPGSKLILAENEAEVIGFALFRTIFDECELMMIAVHPQGQSKGIGGKLFDYLIKNCQNNGVRKIHIEVRADNPALNFYMRRGCTVIGQRSSYYKRTDGGPDHAITLSLDIFDKS
jgi:[ribosomal protein S18]-alanine N-acetyltransferase